MADIDEKASGDVEQEIPHVPSPLPPEPPKIPDVELIVDGFGFMPKVLPVRKERPSKVFDKAGKSKMTTEVVAEEQRGGSSCASSTNVDIVRRYTWKTKNRMMVQVIYLVKFIFFTFI